MKIVLPRGNNLQVFTAVETKLLLNDASICGSLAEYGAHHPSATTLPWRTSMKLCSAPVLWSASATNRSRSAEDTPWDSGLPRGRTGAWEVMNVFLNDLQPACQGIA